jgi:hypothetical protein
LRLDLYQGGLALRSRWHSRWIAWSELTEVYQIPLQVGWHRRSVPRGEADSRVVWRFRLVDRHRRTVSLFGWQDLQRVGERIQQEVTRRAWPRIEQDYRRGQRIRFGRRLAVSREGVHLGVDLLNWRCIAQAKVDPVDGLHIVPIHVCRPAWHVPAHRIANLPLLSSLLEFARPTASPPQDGSERLPEAINDRDEAAHLSGTVADTDVSQLLLEGFDWEDIGALLRGECSVEELQARGPVRRPRYPR